MVSSPLPLLVVTLFCMVSSNKAFLTSTEDPKLLPSDFLERHQHVGIDIDGDHRSRVEFSLAIPGLNKTIKIATRSNRGFVWIELSPIFVERVREILLSNKTLQ